MFDNKDVKSPHAILSKSKNPFYFAAVFAKMNESINAPTSCVAK